MFNQSRWILALLLLLSKTQAADFLQLKGDAAVAGRILAEKADQVVIDLGYTVLMIPRDQIVNVTSNVLTAQLATADKPRADAKKEPADATVAQSGMSNRVSEVAALFHSSSSPGGDRSVKELVNLLGSSVVQVKTPSGLGSGFIIHEDGFLITNFHVIESETQIAVEVYLQSSGHLDRRTYKQARIVAMNKFADLALLKIEDKDAPKFQAVSLGDSEDLSVGERVFAIGSPLGLERTVTEGIVSTKSRPLQGELYLQTTTQINPGNSGGPLFNLRGEVVGVTNMKIAFGEGLGFAIPVDAVKYFLQHRDAFAYDNDNPSSPYRYLEPPGRVGKVSAKQ